MIALLDRGDAHHDACIAALDDIHEPLISVWPALAEAMHLLGDTPRAPQLLLDLIAEGGVELAALNRDDVPRISELMAKYADTPMDFADAALVRAAEQYGTSKILTFDKHFTVYRLGRNRRFTVLGL